MSPQELYNSFLLGKDLPSLSLSAARRLLDQARSALLTAGRTLKNATSGTTAEAKAAILAAHRQLQRAGIAEGNTQIYAQATEPIEVQLFGCSADAAVELFQKHRQLSGKPRSAALDACLTKPPTTTAATRPALPRVADLATIATASERQGKDLADLKRRVGVVAAKLQPLKNAPAATPAPSPLADYSLTKLAWLATHRSAHEADRQTARAELRRRGATITASGIVSQSTRRQPK
jgi:hypothetical protein